MKTLSTIQKMIIVIIAGCSIFFAIAATVTLAMLDIRTVSKKPTPMAIVPSPSTLPASTVLPRSSATASNQSQPTVEPSPVDPIWAQIEKSGKIVVGMTADHPPFSYIDENFNIQGYDLALITEVGRRLGYPLEIRNMAFDRLFSSLQLNEIDLAVAALPLNEARGAYVNFSIIYYVGEDAVLANKDSDIEIERFEELASYRIGVQRGSIYETWMHDIFIDPGMMQPQKLLLFSTPIEAAEALVQENPSIDLVLLDSMPAEIAERAMDVKIIANELNPQLYALAIPDGAIILQSKLNEAMMQMQHDGTLRALAKRYLSVENPLPVPTTSPFQFWLNQTDCLNSYSLIAEINYIDDDLTQPPIFSPGISFQKGWRIRNTGTCIWDSTYVLVFIDSNPPNAPVGGNAVAVQGFVAPGQTYDLYANLTTPLEVGIYESNWSLRDPMGIHFGDRLKARFEVVIGESEVLENEMPSIFSFNVSPNQISMGDCIDITWSFGGEDIRLSRLFRNDDLILYDLPLTGSYEDCPSGTGQVAYVLIIDSQDAGSVLSTRYVYINVIENQTAVPTVTQSSSEAPPIIHSFSASPKVISLGQCVQLSWQYTATNSSDVYLYRDGLLIASGITSPGSRQDCPISVGKTEYRLVVSTPNSGSTEQSVFIIVHSN